MMASRKHPIADLEETIAILQYTGGTTGAPKGAMLTHANLTAATSQCVETTGAIPPLLILGEERVLSVLPPFHIYSLTVVLLLDIRLGASRCCTCSSIQRRRCATSRRKKSR